MSRPVDAVIAAATAFLGDRITVNAALRDHHSHGQDTQPPMQPDAVAFIETSEEAAKLLGLCHAHNVPVVPFGAGTSLEGHVTPVRGGISLDMSRMTRIIEVSGPDMDCRVEAGVTRDMLNAHLRDQGLFFPVDPGTALCTLGGMCATRASGTNAVRYGTIREQVMGLTVALPDGRLIRTGGRVRKSATGYDLTHLFIGSEGTLGIITEIQLRLHGIPEAASAATCQFDIAEGRGGDGDRHPADAASRWRGWSCSTRCRWPPASLIRSWRICRRCRRCSSNSTARRPASRNRQRRPRRSHRASTPRASSGRRTRPSGSHLWQARHDAYWAALASKPGHSGIATDAIVPISRMDEAILGAKEDIAASGLSAPMVGHVGDGNFHTVILVPPEPDGLQRAWDLDRKIVARALALGGSCSGEHGVGIGKREFLEQEHGAETLAVMRSVKTAIDPRGIMNPGKIFLN